MLRSPLGRAGAAVLTVMVLAAGARVKEVRQASDEVSWYRSYTTNSRMVPLPDGRRLNLYCIGSGSPTVLLEAGIGESAFTWWPVQERIGALTRVCAYDRAGLGFSPPGPLPRDTRSEVADLEALLVAAKIGGPYVVVGHSMGGLNARLFAGRHLKEVAGIVLIDPAVEDQLTVLEAAVPEIAKGDRVTLNRARACGDPARTAEIAKYCIRPAPPSFPADLAQKFAETQTFVASQTFQSEVESFMTVDSRQVIEERRSFGAIPLVVLTRGNLSTNMPEEMAKVEWRLWNQLHDDVAKLSTSGSNRVIQGAGHYIHVDQPNAVLDAIAEVLQAARRPR